MNQNWNLNDFLKDDINLSDEHFSKSNNNYSDKQNDVDALLDIIISRGNSVYSIKSTNKPLYDDNHTLQSLQGYQNDDTYENCDNNNFESDEEELHVLSSQIAENNEIDANIDNDFNDDNGYNANNKIEDNLDNTQTSKQKDLNVKGRYQSILAKPVASAGNIDIGVGKARLYGLLDKDGNVNLPAVQESSANLLNKKSAISKVNSMSKAIEIPIDKLRLNYEEEKELTFKPNKSSAALKAMQNPRCGYEFVNKSNDDKSNSLERLTVSNSSQGLSKSALEALENDYNAKIDKLACPKCQKAQSFSEFYEKKRFCSQCTDSRFRKLNVSNIHSFHKQVGSFESKRIEKLKTIEEEMYGEMKKKRDFKSKPVPTSSTVSVCITKNNDENNDNNELNTKNSLDKIKKSDRVPQVCKIPLSETMDPKLTLKRLNGMSKNTKTGVLSSNNKRQGVDVVNDSKIIEEDETTIKFKKLLE